MKVIMMMILPMVCSAGLLATEQDPDILYQGKDEFCLETGWGHPSPLETYFQQNDMDYPFAMVSTANYRGHIATWRIIGDQLFLKEIMVRRKVSRPSDHGIRSRSGKTFADGRVLADWFSGILECGLVGREDGSAYHYFHIRAGKVVDVQALSGEELKRLSKASLGSIRDLRLKAKHEMLVRHLQYVAYYFRLCDDFIELEGRQCMLVAGARVLSPIFGYFGKGHVGWPYNWENLKQSGAPNCTWKVADDKLFLVELRLHGGLMFYDVDVEELDLEDIFRDRVRRGVVHADWVNGVYLVKQGRKTGKKHFSGPDFEISAFTFLRIADGRVMERHTVPHDFDFSHLPDDLDAGLKKIIEDFTG